MDASRRGHAALLLVAVALVGAGCAAGSSVSDSEIVAALHLQKTARGYEMGGDPFCRIDEFQEANDQSGHDFVIASPDARIGVLARPPFAPDCTRRARDALKKLERKQD